MKRSNIILIDKPKGISSFDVIRILRKKLGIKKMGHSGTLDPLASGLLIIGVGKGTKKLKNFLKLPKVYLMEVILGLKTESGDLEGRVIEKRKVKKITSQKIKKVLKEMEKELELKIPIFSAKKVKGSPLYKLARQKKKIEPPKKKMKIFYLKLLDQIRASPPSERGEIKGSYILEIEMKCGAGTYARSVAEEIGKRLGTVATLKNLRRTKIGDYDVKDALRASWSDTRKGVIWSDTRKGVISS